MVVKAYAVCIGVTPECRRKESEMIRDGWGHADKVYHDITPLLCCYVSEQHSASLTSGAVRCSWSGSSGGVWGIRVLEVEFLYNGWGIDLHVGEPHVIEVRPPSKLNQLPYFTPPDPL